MSDVELGFSMRCVTDKKRRFYASSVRPSLFGEWTVIKEWGRIGSPGTVRVQNHGDRLAALTAWSRLRKRRLGRGYVDQIDMSQ